MQLLPQGLVLLFFILQYMQSVNMYKVTVSRTWIISGRRVSTVLCFADAVARHCKRQGWRKTSTATRPCSCAVSLATMQETATRTLTHRASVRATVNPTITKTAIKTNVTQQPQSGLRKNAPNRLKPTRYMRIHCDTSVS